MSAAKRIPQSPHPRIGQSPVVLDESGVVLVGSRAATSDEIELAPTRASGVTTTDSLATRMGGAVVLTAFVIAVIDAFR